MHDLKYSRDYCEFSTLEGNRPINAGHLKRLIFMIAEKNLLNFHPLLVGVFPDGKKR